jgi:predicted nucleic acid-binding protein
MNKKIVTDTNLFVAAGFNKSSASSKILNLIEKGKLDLIWHKETLKETKYIIKKIPPLNWSVFKGLFQEQCEFRGDLVPDSFKNIDDHSDRKFASLADKTNSSIITNDDHFLSVRKKLDLKVYTPVEFINLYNE